ncbi:uncharacterized protein LOC133328780 [Musca vetustissima]|uniref:uncharacterized protein LOC133328780 n=1 Tax=Musca vetustissima TaxID=27455 RepID=UPI002AB60652|nr:uncharacterized protein LOC133328780 [Musca vetustissima]
MKYLQLLLTLTLTLPLLTHTYPAAEEKSLPLDDVGVVDNDEAASAKDSQLQKRSGSTDYALHLKSGLLSGLGHASASIASSSSGGSSGGGYAYKPHGDGHHIHGHVEFDPWSLKKSVLNTIFQAVKAITGGVTALKGQLIKGSGYALSASGNLVAASGDKVTDVGKYIINSAQSKLHPIPSGHGGSSHGGGGGVFAKFASLSGASSGGSSSSGGKPSGGGHVVHTESITSYEIPSGHTSYGPPSKPPTYSSATHQYLPPSGGGYGGGHVAFEEPSSNYLPTAYGPDATHHHNHYVAAPPTGQEFNIYGRHQKLSDEEARKAAVQLQEILNMLPDGKTEYTASKTVALDTSNFNTGYGSYGQTGSGDQVDLNSLGLPTNLGQLESLSHTESITAAYAADIYHQMQKQKNLSPEEKYLQKHPQEGYDYKPASSQNSGGYTYNAPNGGNSPKDALQDLTPIIAALEVAKRQNPAQSTVSYAVEKNVHKIPPPPNKGSPFIPPAVKKTKYIYYPPTPSRYQEFHTNEYNKPAYNGPYKVRRHIPDAQMMTRRKRKAPLFRAHDYGNEEHLMYNPIMGEF